MELGINKEGYKIGKNKDGTKDRLLLQVELTEDDIRTVEMIAQAGEDTNPAEGCRVVVLDLKGFLAGIATSDDLTPEVNPGEKEIYSTDNPATEKKAWIKFNGNGILDLNGNARFAAAFEDLKTGFDQLLSDFNDLVTAYNAHIHTTTAVTGGGGPPGVIAPTTSTGTPSSASVDDSKVETVKVP